ncbi:hypothetical protein BD779DRAFT_1535810 [Infundibulicybe gibba]|nr:hypothetical protein BD779DRAFT_1535810 [Infundibulicybe gibba]
MFLYYYNSTTIISLITFPVLTRRCLRFLAILLVTISNTVTTVLAQAENSPALQELLVVSTASWVEHSFARQRFE